MAAFRITVVASVFVDRHPSPESMTSSEFIVAQHRSTKVTWIVSKGCLAEKQSYQGLCRAQLGQVGVQSPLLV